MTAPFTSARQLLERVFPLHQRRSQPPTDWRGPIPLPTPLIAYYQEIGPLDLALPAYGTDFFLPSLARLWDYQAGYRWHGLTGEQLPDWDHRWLVIADQAADPVVLSCDTGAVRYGRHGQGAWELAPFLPDLPTTITCLVTLAEIIQTARVRLWGDDILTVAARHRLTPLVGSRTTAERVLTMLGWD